MMRFLSHVRGLFAAVTVIVAATTIVAAPAVGGQKTVGKVTSLAGNVKVQATPKARAVAAKKGMKLRLGSTIVMGKGARATLRLQRPAGVPASRVLVNVKSASGTKHKNTITRDGTAVIVTIVPA